MIKLKQEVNKTKIMRELHAQAEITFKDAWYKDIRIQAYSNGVHDLFKKLRIEETDNDIVPFSDKRSLKTERE